MKLLPKSCNYKTGSSENVVRAPLATKIEVEKWVKQLEDLTKESWSITKTWTAKGVKQDRNVFKRIYHCHRSTRTQTSTSTVTSSTSSKKVVKKSRNIQCPAQLYITIKQFIPTAKSSSSDPLLADWPCVIEFRNDHNHRLLCAESLRERPVSEEAKTKILQLFEKGHSVSSAYHTYCMTMMEELGDSYEEDVLDRHYFPTKIDVQSLWRINFKAHYGPRTGEGMLVQVEHCLKLAAETNGTLFKIQRIETDYAVAICTPIMQRTAKLPQASEIMFVDATGNCDVQDHKIYMFVTQTPAGGVPLGCILSSSQKTDVLYAAVKLLHDILPTKICPSVILTDDDMSERNVLKLLWPKSTLLLCTFHVLKACWKWIQTSKNGIAKEDTQSTYNIFRNILAAETEDALDEAKKQFYEFETYPQFKKYVEAMIDRIELWCLFYRRELMIRGSNTNNYTEVIFRLLKDIALERTKAFNLTQLTDFIVTNFECYYKQRLLDLVLNRVSKSTHFRYLHDDKDVLPSNILKTGNLEYSVTSTKDENVVYIVDMLSCKCTCPVGYNGKHCKHQAAVVKKDNIFTSINTLSTKMKIKLFEVACGKMPEPETFLPLQGENNFNLNPELTKETPRDFILETEALNSDLSVESIGIPSNYDINILKEKWKAYSEQILKKIDENPVAFYPAVSNFLSNKEKYAKTDNSLLSGLHYSFKYAGVASKGKRKCVKKGKMISVQPSSVTRRKVSMGGKRQVTAGRKMPSLRRKKTKAPHSLQTCVELNVGLGENKFKK